jgi:beta-lactam-binding protein with PASTA domain
LARFISIDPESGQPGFPGAHNAYAYAANNPYRYKDPKGTNTTAIPKFINTGGLAARMWTAGATFVYSPVVQVAARVTGWGAVALAGWWAWDESELRDQAESEKQDAEVRVETFLNKAAGHLEHQERVHELHLLVPHHTLSMYKTGDPPVTAEEASRRGRIEDIRKAIEDNLHRKRKPLDGLTGSRPEDIRKTGGKSEPVPLGLPGGGAKKKPPAAPNEEKPASSDDAKKPKDDPTQPPSEPSTPKPANDPKGKPTDPTIPKVGLPGPGSKFFNDPTNIDDLFDDLLGPAEEPKKPESPQEKDKDQTPLEPPEPKVEPVIPEDQDKPPTDPDAKPPGTDMPPPDQDTGQPGESNDNQPTDDGPATDDKGRRIEPWQRPIVDRIIDIMLGGDDAPHDPDGAGQPPAGEDPGSEPPHIPFGPDPPRIYEPPPPPWDPPKRRRPPLGPPENTPPPGPGPRTPPPQQTPPPPTKPPVKPATVTVPNIVGLPATQLFSSSAASILFNAGLSWKPQSLGPAPSKAKENRIERQDPPAGTKVAKGTTVTGYIYGSFSGGPPSTPAGPAKPPTEPAKPPVKPPVEPAKPPAEPAKPPAERVKPPMEPAKPPMEPAKPPMEPVRPPTEPVKPPTEPVKPPTEPGKPPMEPGKPPMEPVKPPTEPAKPPMEPAKPPMEPAKPPMEPGKPPVDPDKPPVDPDKPPADPSKPPADPSKPSPPKPSRVKVPNLVGKKATEAREALTTLGLVPESELGKLAPTADQVLRVYSQDPAKETEVDVPSTVKLLIFNNPDQPMVNVPDVVGKAAAEARQAIKEATLVPKLQMGKAAPDAKKSLQVYSQDPGAGTEAAAESTVNLLIYSQLEGPMVTVPDVVGKTAAEARQAVTGAKLSPKLLMGQAAPSPAQALQVYRQNPAAGTRVDEGSEVQLLIYGQETDEPATPPGTRLTVPSVIGLRAADAKRKIQDAGLAAQLNLGQAAPAADKAATVYQQDPPAGTVSAQGDRVKVTIYDEMASDSKPPTKPVPPSRRPTTLAGQWKCSCGATWVFQQTGQKVTGTEVHGKEYIRGQEKKLVQVTRSVSGVFDGRLFRFTWQDSDGRANGSGEMAADREVSRLNWSMHDNVSGATWSGSISRATN